MIKVKKVNAQGLYHGQLTDIAEKVSSKQESWHETETNKFIDLCGFQLAIDTGILDAKKHHNTFDRYFRRHTNRPVITSDSN